MKYLILLLSLATASFILLCLMMHVWPETRSNSEFTFKGKTYVVAGLQGTGYTRQHRSPVYTLVVMAKEDTQKWTKD